MPNTRMGPRTQILGHLSGEITVIEPLSVKELGVGGATIETRFALVLDSLHELRLSLGTQTIVLKGRVVHSHISDVGSEGVAYHSGVEFVDVHDHVRDAISKYLVEIESARKG